MLKIILTLKTRATSVLGAQIYGKHAQQSKPINKSILASCVYTKGNDDVDKGKTKHDSRQTQKISSKN